MGCPEADPAVTYDAGGCRPRLGGIGEPPDQGQRRRELSGSTDNRERLVRSDSRGGGPTGRLGVACLALSLVILTAVSVRARLLTPSDGTAITSGESPWSGEHVVN